MSQTIDLAAAVSATFNGTDLGEIKLNSASCWTKPSSGPTGQARVFGRTLSEFNYATEFGQKILFGNGTIPYGGYGWGNKTNITHNMEQGEAFSSGGLYYIQGTSSTNVNRLTKSDHVITFIGVLDDNNTIQVYGNTPRNSWDFGWYVPPGEHSSGPSTSTIPMISFNEFKNIVSPSLFNSISISGSGASQNRIDAIVVKKIFTGIPYTVHGVDTVIDNPLLGSTVFHVGHYDSSKSFVVDDLFNSTQTIVSRFSYPGNYGAVNYVSNSFEITKTASNSFSITGGNNSNGDYIGPINGNLSLPTKDYYQGSSNYVDCPLGIVPPEYVTEPVGGILHWGPPFAPERNNTYPNWSQGGYSYQCLNVNSSTRQVQYFPTRTEWNNGTLKITGLIEEVMGASYKTKVILELP